MRILIDTQSIIWFAENNPQLPLYHRDPFDRLIIAQSVVENTPIITSDDAFDAYSISRIW
jgi:PIN domain nuclease of toxin-antitoxin system